MNSEQRSTNPISETMSVAHSILFSVLLLSICFSSPSYAESSVWRVEKEGLSMFLGGTLHLLSSSDFPLPIEYDQAYKQADTLVFEADIRQTQTLQGQTMAMSAMMYKDGRTLRGVLRPQTYEKLEAHLLSKGLPMMMFEQFTAGGMSMTLSTLEMQSAGYTLAGVDQYFIEKAAADGKSLVFLERIEEQLAFVADMGAGQEDELIEYSLAEIERMPTLLASMKHQWRAGDLSGLERTAIKEMKELFPSIYQTILIDRNDDWITQIDVMHATPEVEFVLVGAAHMAGEDGLVQLLELKGYSVSKL